MVWLDDGLLPRLAERPGDSGRVICVVLADCGSAFPRQAADGALEAAVGDGAWGAARLARVTARARAELRED